MEQRKIEIEFKNQLNKREIKPSVASWDRLDAMLTVAEKEKSKKTYGWLYMAASILGFMFILSIYLSQTEKLIDIKRNEILINNNQMVNTTPKLIQENDPITNISSSNQSTANLIKSKKSNPIVTNENKSERVSIIINPINENQKSDQIIENQKVENPLVFNTTQNSDQEILTIPDSKIKLKTPIISVNPNSLLSQVDTELNLSFREKVIKTIDKNYKTLKVAIVNRNQIQTFNN